MKGDFSRDTYKGTSHYTQVLMQQGRVQVDADWNEQQAINNHQTETTKQDVIGPCGAPRENAGFSIGLTPDGKDLTISPGRIYVDGILCELEASWVDCQFNGSNGFIVQSFLIDDRLFLSGQWIEVTFQDNFNHLFKISSLDIETSTLVCDSITGFKGVAIQLRRITTYLTQADYPEAEPLELGVPNIAYLDVWQRHMTSLDDAHTREIALGGPDTATRLKNVWQIRIIKLEAKKGDEFQCNTTLPQWETILKPYDGKLSARAKPSTTINEPCLIPSGAGYRGMENQLYRVEIHEGTSEGSTSFKWSRDNGTVVSKIEFISGSEITVSSVGLDNVLGFNVGQTVEILDNVSELKGQSGVIARVVDINVATRVITINPVDLSSIRMNQYPRLRRWDCKEIINVQSNAGSDEWIELENGVEVLFSAGRFKTGDYWLIPARTANQDVEWPRDMTERVNALLPHGIKHHFCRLALLKTNFDNKAQSAIIIEDCRRIFSPLPKASNTFHIVNTSWKNDDVVSLKEFLTSLTIDFDAEPNSLSLTSNVSPASGSATVIVALEMGTNTLLPTSGLDANFATIILDGDVSVKGKTLIWRPKDNLSSELSKIIRKSSVRVRVTLKGYAIWSEFDGRRFYLAGESLGQSGSRPDGSSRIVLTFPTGESERVNDFESWFYLAAETLPTLALVDLQVNPSSIYGGNQSTGTVIINLPAPEGGTEIGLTSSRSNLVSIQSSVMVPSGQFQANFPILALTNNSERDQNIDIKATLNQIMKKATLTVKGTPP